METRHVRMHACMHVGPYCWGSIPAEVINVVYSPARQAGNKPTRKKNTDLLNAFKTRALKICRVHHNNGSSSNHNKKTTAKNRRWS